MKKILLFGLIIPALCWALIGISCFDAPRDNVNDPKADNFTGSDLFLFSTASEADGAIGTRDDIDTLCINRRIALDSDLPSDHVKAFIGMDSPDAINDMPANYGLPTWVQIKGPTGSIIANNWADLLDGTIMQSLQAAGVSSVNWWSGADYNGDTDTSLNCNNWVSGTNPGVVGDITAINSSWIYGPQPNCGTSGYVVLCICWND